MYEHATLPAEYPLFEPTHAPDSLHFADTTPIPRTSRLRKIANVALVGLMGISSVGVATNTLYAGLLDIRHDNQQGLIDCDQELPIAPVPTLQSARNQVAAMRFGIQYDQYLPLIDQVNHSDNDGAIQQQLDSVTAPQGTTIRLRSMYSEPYGLIPMPNTSVSHEGGALSLAEIKTGSNQLLEGMSQTPAWALQDTTVHLTKHLRSGSGEAYAGEALTYRNGERHIAIDLAAEQGAGEVLKHEVTHTAHETTCGHSGAHNDRLIQSYNGRNFTYVDKNLAAREALAKQNKTVDPYAGKNVMEDVAESGEALLQGELTTTLSNDKPIVAKKMQQIAARQAIHDPAMPAYYHYLAYLGNKPFPGDIARANDPYAECFGIADYRKADSSRTIHDYTYDSTLLSADDQHSNEWFQYRYATVTTTPSQDSAVNSLREQDFMEEVARIRRVGVTAINPSEIVGSTTTLRGLSSQTQCHTLSIIKR